jgi:hypothetical protein
VRCRRVKSHGRIARDPKTSGGAWRLVWCRILPIPVATDRSREYLCDGSACELNRGSGM